MVDANNRQEGLLGVTSLMSPFAARLRDDVGGDLRDEYCRVFEDLQNQMSVKLRQPMSREECEACQAIFDVTGLAAQVVRRFWDRCRS